MVLLVIVLNWTIQLSTKKEIVLSKLDEPCKFYTGIKLSRKTEYLTNNSSETIKQLNIKMTDQPAKSIWTISGSNSSCSRSRIPLSWAHFWRDPSDSHNPVFLRTTTCDYISLIAWTHPQVLRTACRLALTVSSPWSFSIFTSCWLPWGFAKALTLWWNTATHWLYLPNRRGVLARSRGVCLERQTEPFLSSFCCLCKGCARRL